MKYTPKKQSLFL